MLLSYQPLALILVFHIIVIDNGSEDYFAGEQDDFDGTENFESIIRQCITNSLNIDIIGIIISIYKNTQNREDFAV